MTRRPIQIDDLYRIRLVADPNISPDGQKVAWVVTTVDKESNGYTSNIWCADLAGDNTPYRLTTAKGKDTSPRWSPDGSMLAFLSERSGGNQIHVMYADGGESWQATDAQNGASEIAWSPDSTSLAFVSAVAPDDTPAKSDVKVITTMLYRMDGEGFFTDKRRQVHIVPAHGGKSRMVTEGDWHSAQPAFSSDGRKLAVVSNRSEGRAENRLSDVWVIELSTGAATRITPEDGSYGTPSWSPTADKLAYVGNPITEKYGPVTLADLYVHDVETDEPRGLLSTLDREPGNSAIADARYGLPNQLPVWAADGSAVYAMLSDAGSVHLYRCAIDGPSAPLIDETQDIQSFSIANDGTIAFASSTMSLPTEVFIRRPDGTVQQLTDTNRDLLNERELGEVREVRFPSDEGVEVHGWLLTPPGFNPAVRYPAIVEVHGGPHGMYGVGFFQEMHVLAARGYVVLYTNPRGSTGYGQEFVAGTLGDWGGADYRDVMAGADYLETLDFVDSNRLGITGGSYGGYMTNWAIGQTDRFKAAVTQRSTANRISTYGTSDMNATYNDWEFAGTPYDNPEHYLERSPLTYVKNITTPLLLIHSENDLRCPIGQSEEFFTALRKLDKVAEFVRFPNESHGLSRTGQPNHRVERLERICGWFDRYL